MADSICSPLVFPMHGAGPWHQNFMKTSIVTRDLAKEPPSSPRERLAGFVILKRTVDKCRARIDGTLGEYHYDCPLDNLLFSFKGITATELQTVVREAKSYEEVGAWLNA